MKTLFAALLATCLPLAVSAQTYWQQEVNYQINVSLNDKTHELTGSETIEYVNNSPDQLNFIYFHLWPNAYKNNKTALAKQIRQTNRKFQFTKPEARGYISNLAFEVNGKAVKLEYEQEDVAKLLLNEPLQPGQRITIATPFLVKIPKAFSRLGHVEQSYQISQWYPKPAVYDHKGWHPMPYLDQGEFYSEYGKFDVKITLPANYTVGATGELQTTSEIARLDSLAAIGNATTRFGKEMAFPASDTRTKTLHYVQDKIHDFAWFADKRFNVRKGEVQLPVSKRMVTTWQMFLNKNAAGWLAHSRDLNEAIYYYSLYVGEYPYASCTAVDGALGQNVGGMEYPMVTVTFPNAIIHEVGHNWFYGILGSNERDHPWMDEGLNSYVENRIGEENDPNYGQLGQVLKPGLKKAFGLETANTNALNLLTYQLAASRGVDQPIEYPAADYLSLNYSGIVYQKTSVVFKYLANYLGQARFDSAMHAYFQKWKFRHPYPADIQASFEASTGEKLDWFFKDMINSTKPVDVEIKREDAGPTGRVVTIKNEGSSAVAIPVVAFDKENNKLETQWTKPFTGITTVAFNTTQADYYVIDPDYLLPELNRRDNQLKTSGLFRKTESFHLQKLLGLEQYNKTQLYWLPVIGANTADKLMLGVAFYNSSVVAKKFNYLVMPMYSFSQKELNGMANCNFNLVPHSSGLIQQAKIGFNFQRFEYFYKYESFVQVNFRRKTPAAAKHYVKLSSTYIYQPFEQVHVQKENPEEKAFNVLHDQEDYTIQNLTYHFSLKNAVQGVSFSANLLRYARPEVYNGGNYAAQAEIGLKRYWNKDKSVSARIYGGGFFNQQAPGFVMGLSGSPDYAKDHVFLDRAQKSEKIRALVDQTNNGDGAFKNYLPVFTDDWLTTLNLEADLPVLPLSAYLDLGKVASHAKLYYGTGLMLSVGEGFFNLYMPLAGSNFTNNTPDNFKDFRRNIRFSLRLDLIQFLEEKF